MQIDLKIPDSLAPHLVGVPEYLIRNICIQALRDKIYGRQPVQMVMPMPQVPVYSEPEPVEDKVMTVELSNDYNDDNDSDDDMFDSLFR